MSNDLALLAKDRNGHSCFAPSASAMWLGCPGSLIPNLLADDDSGYEAAEGTVAHEIGEQWLKTGKKPKHRIGEVAKITNGMGTVFEVEITHTMLDFVEQYVDWCRMLPGHHHVEVRVDFSPLTPIPNQRGTSDHIACTSKRLTVTDLKYGTGVQVFAEKNTQGLLYAYGAFLEFDDWYEFEEIEIRICQPRLDHFDIYLVTREQLLSFGEYVKRRAVLAWKLDAPRKPSAKACQWCRVKANCGAIAKMQEDLAVYASFEEGEDVMEDEITDLKARIDTGKFRLTMRPAAELSVAQMAHMLKYRRLSEIWWNTLADRLTELAQGGTEVPGYKLVEGRSNRKYISDSAAVERYEELGLSVDEMFNAEVITLTAAEDVLRKKGHKRKDIPALLDRIVYKPPGKATLVPEGDKRPTLVETLGDAFGDVDMDDQEMDF